MATVRFNDRFAPQTTASVWGARERRRAARVAEARQEPRARHPDRGARRPGVRARRPLPRGASAAARHAHEEGRAGAAHRAPPSIPAPAASAQTHPAPAEPPPTGPFTLPAFGEWTVRDVERLLAEQGDAFPEQREELELYLDTFRSVAGPDGRLPGDVDLVLEDVFADLIQRAR